MRPFTAKLPDPTIDAGGGVVLRALTPADEDALDALLAEPDVGEWFDADGGELVALIGEPAVTPFMILRDGAAAGYAQIYHANDDDFWCALGVPAETMGFDLALVPDLHGRGIGPRVIRALICRSFDMEGVAQVIIDPHPDNARAIRAYSKCGFSFGPPQPGYYGEPMLLGTLSRSSFSSGLETETFK